LKAINNFDPEVGGSLAAYAQPCISGEIKRHFRDKRWQVHVERSMQELVLQVREAIRQLTQQLGHQPDDGGGGPGGPFFFRSSSMRLRNSSNFGFCSGVRIARIWSRPFCRSTSICASD
ncbi:MAG: sigma factor, partial [Candidatus Acidiferrum sp.]